MQLPPTLSPALCCLLALAVQHVAGLGVPRGVPGIRDERGLGLEAEGCSTGPQAHRRQLDSTPPATAASTSSLTESKTATTEAVATTAAVATTVAVATTAAVTTVEAVATTEPAEPTDA